MVWHIELTETAADQLSKVGTSEARRITAFLRERLGTLDDPRVIGKSLKGPLGGLWRYRVGDYRLICEIESGRLRVLVVSIAHRREAYR